MARVSQPLTMRRTIITSSVAGIFMLFAGWLWYSFKNYLSDIGIELNPLLYMLGLILVMVGSMWLVAGRLLKDIKLQISQNRERKEN